MSKPKHPAATSVGFRRRKALRNPREPTQASHPDSYRPRWQAFNMSFMRCSRATSSKALLTGRGSESAGSMAFLSFALNSESPPSSLPKPASLISPGTASSSDTSTTLSATVSRLTTGIGCSSKPGSTITGLTWTPQPCRFPSS